MITMASIASVLRGYKDIYVWYNQFVDGEDGHAGEYVDCYSEDMRRSGQLSSVQYERFNSAPVDRIEVENGQPSYDVEGDDDGLCLDFCLSEDPAAYEEPEETLTLHTLIDHLGISEGSNPTASLTVTLRMWPRGGHKKSELHLGTYDWHFVHYDLDKMAWYDAQIVRLHLTDGSMEVTLDVSSERSESGGDDL